MNKDFILESDGAVRIYDAIRSLPIIDFHNHLSVKDITLNRRYSDIYELWLAPDPYKHRLMRIAGVEERFITGDAEPFEKFRKFAEIFPYTVGNPVYDWSRSELESVLGISEPLNSLNAKKVWDEANEKLCSEEFFTRGILSKFGIEYQSPVATPLEDLSSFKGFGVYPSLRADELLTPTDALKKQLSATANVEIRDTGSYIKAVGVILDRFKEAGCRFADHSLDDGFFTPENSDAAHLLALLGGEYKRRGFTLLLHLGAKRKTSPRLARLAGPTGGYAAVGNTDVSQVANLLGAMEECGGLPDTLLFPLNLSDIPPLSVLQGSFSEDGVSGKIGLGPSWWWCDHIYGIETALHSVASFGMLSRFIGMTTDSRSILSFVRHDYFRRILARFIDRESRVADWRLPEKTLIDIAERIAYGNAKMKTKG